MSGVEALPQAANNRLVNAKSIKSCFILQTPFPTSLPYFLPDQASLRFVLPQADLSAIYVVSVPASRTADGAALDAPQA
jgi:hypothetical protein